MVLACKGQGLLSSTLGHSSTAQLHSLLLKGVLKADMDRQPEASRGEKAAHKTARQEGTY